MSNLVSITSNNEVGIITKDMILKIESECLDMDSDDEVTTGKLEIAEPTVQFLFDSNVKGETAHDAEEMDPNTKVAASFLVDPAKLLKIDLYSLSQLEPFIHNNNNNQHLSAFPFMPIPNSSSSKNDTRHLSAEDKRQRLLLRNREAAKVSRRKKKHYVQDMENRIAKLTSDNQKLHHQLKGLRTHIELKAQLHQLKAQLNMIAGSNDSST